MLDDLLGVGIADPGAWLRTMEFLELSQLCELSWPSSAGPPFLKGDSRSLNGFTKF